MSGMIQPNILSFTSPITSITTNLVPTDHLIFVLRKTITLEHFSLSFLHKLKFKSQNLFSNFLF